MHLEQCVETCQVALGAREEMKGNPTEANKISKVQKHMCGARERSPIVNRGHDRLDLAGGGGR